MLALCVWFVCLLVRALRACFSLERGCGNTQQSSATSDPKPLRSAIRIKTHDVVSCLDRGAAKLNLFCLDFTDET